VELRKALLSGTWALVVALAGGLIMLHEGLVPFTHADPVGIPSICYGTTGADAAPGRVATPEECKALLDRDMQVALRAVERCIAVPLHAHELAALISFTYNIGGGALCSSTLARLANAGKPAVEWCAQMTRWVWATRLGVKVRLRGLERRRVAEHALCIGRLFGAGFERRAA